jgi:tetratricopeptide (TPR) repeat protein
LSALDSHISPERRSLAVKLFRIELLVRSGHYHDALSRIAAIRDETSSAENIALLDDLEFDSFLSLGRFSQAETVLLRIDHRLSGNGDNLSQTLLRAKFLFVRNDQQQAISLLLDALDTYPDSPSLLALFAEYVATASTPQAANMIDRALDAALQAVRETMFADPGTLATLSHTLFRAGRFVEARLLLDHALVLAPSDRSIHTLREELGTTTCTEPPSP